MTAIVAVLGGAVLFALFGWLGRRRVHCSVEHGTCSGDYPACSGCPALRNGSEARR
jgi:hypothetical protein